MLRAPLPNFDPKLDLLLERVIDVPREAVWAVWTQPELLKQWFCPLPWKTVDCEMDLRPGGIFRTVMRGPNGEEFGDAGCFLDVIENERLIFTGALHPGFRPKKVDPNDPTFTAVITIVPEGSGTRYSALAMHRDEAGCQAHAKMGFHEGWGKALDQLVDVAKKFRK